MAVTTAAPTQTDYPALFRRYIRQSARHLLPTVEATDRLLSPTDRDQALHTLSYALKWSEAWPETRRLLLAMAPKMEQAGYREAWQPYLEQGLAVSRQLSDAETEATLHLHLGILHQLRTTYDQARQHLEAGAMLFEQRQARQDQARVLNRLAYVARLQRRFEEATALVETVQELLPDENDEERAFSYYVLGLVALDNRAWSAAVDFSDKAFKLWAHTDQRRLMGRSLLCRGVALEKMGRFDEAMGVCRQAISLFGAIQDRFYEAIARMNLGNVYVALKRPHDALDLYVRAERIFREMQDWLHLGHVSNNIGVVYRHLQVWDKARLAYSDSVVFWRKNGNIERLVNAMDGLGLSYFQAQQYHQAEIVFQEALEQLSQIEGKPGYEHWFQILTSHLDEASAKTDQ